jgi:pyrroloquinoline quinone biosynthesis protein E
MSFANVRETSLRDAWASSDAFEKFRGTHWMPEPCRSCAHRETDWGGCRCQAAALLGNAGLTDPACALSPHHAVLADAIEQAASAGQDFVYREYARAPAGPPD